MEALIQLTQRTDALAAIVIALAAVVYMMLQGRLQFTDRLIGLEALMRRPIAIGLIGVTASVLLGAGAVSVPTRVRVWLSRPEIRFLVIAMAGFAGAGDVETSIIGTLFVLSLLQLARTPEERKATPFLV